MYRVPAGRGISAADGRLTMNEPSQQFRAQWTQLVVLTAAHAVWDTFAGLMHTVLPALQESFGFSVAAGGVLLTVFLIAANIIQLVVGHVRPNRDKPFFLYLGTALTCVIIFFRVVPAGTASLLWLMLISIGCGAGLGITHPEALRAIHRLNRISSAVSSSVFIAGGVVGFSIGGWASTYLFKAWGFAGLVPFCAVSVLTLAAIRIFGIRLAVEADADQSRSTIPPQDQIPFWRIMAIAILAACSVQILMWILPQHLSACGADLTLGGRTVSLFSLAGGAGGILMSRYAQRDGELKLIRRMLLCGIPFIIAYLFLIRYAWAVGLLCAGGFFCFGTYPLMVSVGRSCAGLNLGGRMGLIVGGVWLAAGVFPLLLGPVADRFGTPAVLFCVPLGFVLSLVLTLKTKRKG